MKFNLGATAPVSNQGTANQFEAGKISKAKFAGFVQEKIEKKDKSATFDVVKVKFEGIGEDSGKKFEHTIFEPRDGVDNVRKPNDLGWENPSNVEEIQFLFAHLVAAVAPENSKKLAGLEVDGWKGLVDVMTKLLAKAVGKETEIKLMPDKDLRPRFPGYVLGISKAGETYPRTNYIGKGLTFTAGELKQIETRLAAKPTQMATVTKAVDAIAEVSVEDDLDFDVDSI